MRTVLVLVGIVLAASGIWATWLEAGPYLYGTSDPGIRFERVSEGKFATGLSLESHASHLTSARGH